SYEGEQFKDLPNARDMFWIIIDKQACGGRYGLLPLFKEIVRGMLNAKYKYNRIEYEECYDNCSLLRRITSLFINGKKVKFSSH
ncbi:MAG: hypothetical protein D6752_01690, partial [Candidatus Nitrosothermus koennekii]